MRELVTRFDECVRAYDEDPPFSRFEQLESHMRTIERRRALPGVEAAIYDDGFTASLYATLQRWGIGRRASRLVGLPEFRLALRAHVPALRDLETLSIDAIAIDPGPACVTVANVIADLGIVENAARIVPGTKTLHHLLPDLVPPMDRQWTKPFFGWSSLDMQYRQGELIRQALGTFAEIAAETNPARLVGPAWRTSATKVLDNALIGYLRLKDIRREAAGSPR